MPPPPSFSSAFSFPPAASQATRFLFSRCSSADLSDLSFLDQVAQAISVDGTVPADARLPPQSAASRFRFISEQLRVLHGFLSAGDANFVMATAGPDGVFDAVGELKEKMRDASRRSSAPQPSTAPPSAPPAAPSAPPAPAPASPNHSYGSLASNHVTVAGFHQALNHPAAAQLSPAERSTAFQTRVHQAATNVELERGRSARPLSDAVQSLSSLPPLAPDGTGVVDEASVRALGRAITSLPPDLAVLEQAPDVIYNQMSSELLNRTVTNMKASRDAFVRSVVPLVVAKIGRERPSSLSDLRKDELRLAVTAVLRGDLASLSEKQILGVGGSSLTASMRSVPPNPQLTLDALEAYEYVASFCYPAPASGSVGYFGRARDLARSLLDSAEAPVSPSEVASFLDGRVTAFPMKQFRDGSLLVRPLLNASQFSTNEAVSAFQRCGEQARLRAEARAALQEQVQHQAQLAGSVGAAAPPLLPSPQPLSVAPPPFPPPLVAPPVAQWPPGKGGRGALRGQKRGRGGAPAPALAAAAPAPPPSPSPALPPPNILPAPPPAPPAGPAPAPAPPARPFTRWDGVIVDADKHRIDVNARGCATPNGQPWPSIDKASLQAWSAQNKDGAGKGRCFNFWMRGQCIRPTALGPCGFSHV